MNTHQCMVPFSGDQATPPGVGASERKIYGNALEGARIKQIIKLFGRLF